MVIASPTWIDWIREHDWLLFWGGVASLVMFVGTLAVIPVIITRMGEDYFMPDRRRTFADLHPVLRIVGLFLKNLLGLVLVLMGVIMIFIPGQGLLTILLGLGLLDFPGKRGAELRLIRYPPVRRSIDWIRKKASRPPLRIPEDGRITD